jgi:hypothetical protein
MVLGVRYDNIIVSCFLEDEESRSLKNVVWQKNIERRDGNHTSSSSSVQLQLPSQSMGKKPWCVTVALKTSNIKTVLSILRTIDTEDGRQLRTGIDLYIQEPETPVRITRDISVSATSWRNRHRKLVD